MIMKSCYWMCVLIAGMGVVHCLADSQENEWGLEPLGGVVIAEESGPPPVKQELRSRYQRFANEGEPLILASDGLAHAVLVIPASPSRVERRAATLLQSTLEKIAGVELPVVWEEEIEQTEGPDGVWLQDEEGRKWRYAIWIGNTEAARSAGVHAEDLLPEGYRMKSDGHFLYLSGNDITPSGRRVSGTYHGALALLENYFGVRWLWPGELGTIIPKSPRLILPALHEKDEPVLEQREIRSGTGIGERAEVGLKLLGGTEQEYETYREFLRQRRAWYHRQRCGARVDLHYRHAYDHWYEEYGEEHPEWFALQPNGSRVQTSDRPRLCKSNPEVAAQKAREVIDAYKKNPNLDSVSISPNDGSGWDHFCMCIECRKLDPESGRIGNRMFSIDGQRFYEQYPSFSDRVATFYNRIAEEVVKELPDARLGAYAYSAYRDAPLGVTMHPSIIIGFVGLGYLNEQQRLEDLERWNGWSRSATQLFLRPNLLHDGNALPVIYFTRLAEDLRHCYQTGMQVADFDSLSGHWSMIGLNYYVLAKLLWDPAADEQAIVRDYCEAGFGRAADKVEEYFRLLEEATTLVAFRQTHQPEGDLREAEQDRPGENTVSDNNNPLSELETAYYNVFTGEFISRLRGVLAEAREAAGDEVVQARIDFLENGLDYAELYREARLSPRASPARQALLDWHRKMFVESPETINNPQRLWRTGAGFRGL